MRRLLVVALLLAGLVAPPAVLAQVGTPGIGYPPASGTIPGPLTLTTGPLKLSSGQLLLPNGSSGAPSFAFSSAVNEGIYNRSNTIVFSVAGEDRFQITGAAFGMPSNAGGLYWGSAADLWLYRDAANTLALRNGGTAGAPVPQTFNIYNFCDGAACATGYERAFLRWNAGVFELGMAGAGTGVAGKALSLTGWGSIYTTGLNPAAADTYFLGTTPWRSVYISRSIEGSKTRALVEGAATAVTQIAVPTAASLNFADATVQWSVFATDATDSQVRRGSTYLAAVNKAGTESCTVSDAGTTSLVESAGGSTLACTTSCITGLTDVVQFALNCTSSLTQTILNAQVRLDMMQPNTVTPQ